jgi:hypothetical protein
MLHHFGHFRVVDDLIFSSSRSFHCIFDVETGSLGKLHPTSIREKNRALSVLVLVLPRTTLTDNQSFLVLIDLTYHGLPVATILLCVAAEFSTVYYRSLERENIY